MQKLAICIIAYNEETNISSLIDKVIKSGFSQYRLFVYTDGSIDNTPAIVALYASRYPAIIKHFKKDVRVGKTMAFNWLLKDVKKYEIALFLDADINPSKNSLSNLYRYLIIHKEIGAVSPRFAAYTNGLARLEKTISDLYTKTRQHATTFGKYKYISGRTYCIRTDLLKPIPRNYYFDDFYLNLNIPYGLIGICKDSLVCYKRPVTMRDFIEYNYRLGNALGSIKRNFKDLWKEQVKRISVADYAIFDLTRYKFAFFFFNLSHFEKIVFIGTRLIATFSMYAGLFTYKPEHFLWNQIKSTKVNYGPKRS